MIEPIRMFDSRPNGGGFRTAAFVKRGRKVLHVIPMDSVGGLILTIMMWGFCFHMIND